MKEGCKKIFSVAVVSLALSFTITGCGKKNTTDEPVFQIENEQDAETGSETDAEIADITPGSYEGDDIYENESFGFRMTLASNKWSFKTAQEIADGTGEDVSDIEGVLNGEISPFTRGISYLAIAYNEETGSNIIVTYMCPALNQLDTYMTSEEYVTKAAESYDGSQTGKQDFAGESWDYLERTDLTDASQKILARSENGIIIMITFTVVDEEDCEGMFESK
jgi:predicted small lipoprotein YifL